MAKKKSVTKPTSKSKKKLTDDKMVTIRKSKLAMFQKLVQSKATRSDSHGDAKDPPSGDGDVNS